MTTTKDSHKLKPVLKKTDPNASKSVTLKRTVSIKVVVTEKFKDYMNFELENGFKFTRTRLEAIDAQINLPTIQPVVREKLILEKSQLQESLQDLAQRKASLQGLELNSFFMQGQIDGFVTVNVGDNLYEKLGGMEIVIRDGVVEEIVAVGSQFSMTPQ